MGMFTGIKENIVRFLSKKMRMETYLPTLNAPVHDKILMEIG